jgi:hypothetical protein
MLTNRGIIIIIGLDNTICTKDISSTKTIIENIYVILLAIITTYSHEPPHHQRISHVVLEDTVA